MGQAGNINAEFRLRNAEWQKRKRIIPNSTFRIPNSVTPDRPAASCGSQSKPPRRGPARPMLFAQKLLAPGPQAKHPGNVNPVLDTGPPAEPGVYLKEFIKFRRKKDLRSLVRPQEGQEKGRSRTLLGSLEDYSRRIGYDSTREVLITLPG
jgi:hypothetical protein